MDADTKLWLRNEGDARAVHNGCSLDVLRGGYTVWWIERYCKLYEGEGYAGEPLILHGCKECDHSEFYATTEDWLNDDGTPGPAQAIHLERAALFAECIAHGHDIDWQYEVHMRLYGWKRFSDRWNRHVRRFRQGSIWTPKKQKKSPTLAANGWYLLAGDGEPGQKVFLAAKNGDQARNNSAKHTVEMWLKSPELRAECTLNRSTLQITHESSRSVMYPLSSANASTEKSKEGLNGSVLIDETHVVDRAFVNRINRAGISRSEPMFLEFSTAGNDPDSYGKERFDLATDVQAGTKTDEELFVAIYAAPQDVTDEELEKNFEKYAKMSNPSLGHTIELRELRTDFNRSRVDTLENWGLCKMYRFNIWQQSSNPWIRMDDWAKCVGDFKEEDLLGRTCFGGLDLGLTRDSSAFVLLFPWEENDPPHFRLWPYFFYPQVPAEKTRTKVPWFEWEKKGHLRITDGDTSDTPLIRTVIAECNRKFDLRSVGFDKRFAETLSLDLIALGVNMLEIPQNAPTFAEPMGLFAADIIEGRIEHPNNEVLNWNARNATLLKNGLLAKPEGEKLKKIDGIAAAVMAREMANVGTEKLTYYETHKLEMF